MPKDGSKTDKKEAAKHQATCDRQYDPKADAATCACNKSDN